MKSKEVFGTVASWEPCGMVVNERRQVLCWLVFEVNCAGQY